MVNTTRRRAHEAALALALGGAAALPARADVFVDVGAHTSDVEARIALIDEPVDSSDGGLHLGVGVRRDVGERSQIGARLELDEIGSDRLLAVRAFDTRNA